MSLVHGVDGVAAAREPYASHEVDIGRANTAAS